MRRLFKLTLGLAAICLCSALSARADTITFDSLAQPGSGVTFVGNTYTEGGFTFSGSFGSPQTGHPDYTGTGTLITLTPVSNLVAADASPFNFNAIDLSEPNRGVLVVQFTGFFVGGGTITQTVVTDGVFGLQTFSFAGFTNLSSLNITSPGLDPLQIDNVNLSRVTAPIPEPATVLLLGTGLLGAIGAARHRRRKAQP